ncbi:MAG TPA: hypothetical protein VLO11_04040 [Luteolibacter sp.]|nr:hypothetical protein [Luteolibacter sp.]
MKKSAALFLLACSISVFAADERRASPGETTYHIDPAAGDDSRDGLARDRAWRTFHHLNRLRLAPGDRVEIVAPGELTRTLSLSGAGTAESPIEVRFAPGRYDVLPGKLYREAWQISNTNSDPDTPKAVALHINSASHVRVSGTGAKFVSRGKMIHVCIDGSDRISIDGLSFDYHRPTVSEFRVAETGEDFAIIEIHRDSTYRIADGQLEWTGEGWIHRDGLAQELDPPTGRVRRVGFPTRGLSATEIEPFRVRLGGAHRLKRGSIYQLRDPFRDCAGVFTRRSRDISWKDVKFHFLHGMGVVSQFSENLTFDSVQIAPDPASGRTTAAWADGFHFSGCRGKILVKDCVFSGAHDDAINVHGTHLRIVANPEPHKLRVRFMHAQTFGFMAFNPGDEIDFVHADTLAPYATNRIVAARMIDPKEMELTLQNPAPAGMREHDVLENVTWTPTVEIRGCEVRHIPTRGFLCTTRRPVIIEDNTFHATHMSAILIENDAEGWYESGCVRDMTIRRNRFIECGEPVVRINPRNSRPNPVVHRGIRIVENEFVLRGETAVGARSTTGLRIADNKIRSTGNSDDAKLFQIRDCDEVTIEENHRLSVD